MAVPNLDSSDPGQTIVCFTALPMRLSRWFNYSVRGSHEDLKSLSVDRTWETYKQKLRELASMDRVSLVRCVVTAKVRPKNAIFDFAISTHTEMSADFKQQILLKAEVRNGWETVAPFSGEEVAQIAGNFDRLDTDDARAVAAQIRDWYGSKELSYLILPQSEKPLPTINRYEWLSLARAFAHSAHRHVRLCKYWEFDEASVDDAFDCNEVDQMPEDFFAIGTRDPREDDRVMPKWRFCLAGNVGRELERVTLEIFTDGNHVANRYTNFLNYIGRLWENSQVHELLREA